MSFSGGGGDKLGGWSGGIEMGKVEHVEGLENLFSKAHNKLQELQRLLTLEEKTANAKVSDVGLQSALQRQDKLIQMSRVVLRRDEFGTSSPWGQITPNKSPAAKGGEQLPKPHDFRPVSGAARHSYENDRGLDHSHPQSYTGRREEEEMSRRSGAIPKKLFPKPGPKPSLNEGLLETSCIRSSPVGQARLKESPRALQRMNLQSENTDENENDSGFRGLRDQEIDTNSYGSLDRSFGRRNRLSMSDKQRRHTKAISNLHWPNAENLKAPTTHELGPDEQYLFGLPKVANVQSSKLSRTITASLSQARSPKSPSMRVPAEADSFSHQSSNSRVDCMGHSNYDQPLSSTLKQSCPVSPLFLGQTMLPSPIQTTSKECLVSNSKEESNVELLRKSFYQQGRSSSASGISPSSGAERIANAFSNMRLEESFPEDTVDSIKNRSRELIASKESTKPFEMADYFKYSSKYRGNAHSQSSEATTGSQNEQSRLSLSSGSSSSSSAVDAGFSARSLTLKKFFQQVPHDDSMDIFETPSGEFNRCVSATINNFHSLHSEAQQSLLYEFVVTEEAKSTMIPSSADQNGNKVLTMEEAPELPPRQPRERKESTRDPEDNEQAWVMDTPTFV